MSRKIARVWLSADLHFEHENILRYCSRPFGSVEEMGRKFMAAHRECIHPFDTVYWLGDIVFMRKAIPPYVKPVGRTFLIRGNHDKAEADVYIRTGIIEVCNSLEIEYGGERFLLVHDPMRLLYAEAQKQHIKLGDVAWNDPIIRELAESLPCRVFCGHVHGLFRHFGQFVNVGVDVWNYRPVLIEDAIGAFGEPSTLLQEQNMERFEKLAAGSIEIQDMEGQG